jgi:hypothetical protein
MKLYLHLVPRRMEQYLQFSIRLNSVVFNYARGEHWRINVLRDAIASSQVNRCQSFGGINRLHLRGRRINPVGKSSSNIVRRRTRTMAPREPMRTTEIGPYKGHNFLALFLLLSPCYLLLVLLESLFLLLTLYMEDGPVNGHRFSTSFIFVLY